MEMEIKITFPGGKKVDAEVSGMTVRTDQPVKYGGDGTAPSPFEHFLASIGTCAGIFVLGFCQKRDITTEGITLTQRMEYVPADKGMKLGKIAININLPAGFPEKYKDAIVRVADQCAVKKTIMEPPEFEVTTSVTQ
jgi:ribosomal protein S12 methylthiotransferase accessory factor